MNKIYTTLICLVLGGIAALNATSLRLKNDTKNPMMVEIMAADGSLIGEETVPAFETELWDYEAVMSGKQKSKKAVTPMTVVWKNDKGDVYSTCNKVSSGSMVSPQQCKAK